MKLNYYHPNEFDGHKNKIDLRLLAMIDVLRHMWGRPILVSPSPWAIVRTSGDTWHNAVKHKRSYAIDLMPGGIGIHADPESFYKLSLRLGFNGIGFYPHWYINGDQPRPGFHLDTRTDTPPTRPAIWGAVKHDNIYGEQEYVTIEQALEMGPNNFL